MLLRLETIGEKHLVGQRRTMSLATDATPALWQLFQRQRHHLPPAVGNALYSLQVYPPDYFTPFRPDIVFEKWAAVELPAASPVPAGLEGLRLAGGRYAVFLHRGPASAGPVTFGYIFGTWLPASAYELAERPHFELLGKRYHPTDPSSEEEIWIPIRPRLF